MTVTVEDVLVEVEQRKAERVEFRRRGMLLSDAAYYEAKAVTNELEGLRCWILERIQAAQREAGQAMTTAEVARAQAVAELNCPFKTGLRPCMCDLPQCPVCGYTKHDAAFECDHWLCGGIIPETKP